MDSLSCKLMNQVNLFLLLLGKAAELRNQYYQNQNLYQSISFWTFTELIERRREWKKKSIKERLSIHSPEPEPILFLLEL